MQGFPHLEALRSSVAALRANKFRSFLTALGLVIGNASVILVVTISLTSRDYILNAIQMVGSNLIIANYEAGNNSATTTTAADYVKIVRCGGGAAAIGIADRGGDRGDEQSRPDARGGSRRGHRDSGVGSILSGGAESGSC